MLRNGCQNELRDKPVLRHFEATHLQVSVALEMLSESLIARGRNLLVLRFLADESYIHLFWIGSDIELQAAWVFCLLCAERDVAAGVDPLKIPIGHGNERIGPYAECDGFIGRGTDRLHGHQARGLPCRDEALSTAQLYARRAGRISADPSALALLRHRG